MSREIKKCCICSLEYIGYGNNATPVKEGRCCDVCNSFKVVPARMDNLMDMLTKKNVGPKKRNNE